MKSLPLVAALLFFFSTPALAHRVNIHAWLEGGTVWVHCGFSRSTPAKNSRVTVYDSADGKELLNGVTDDKGDFHFAVPEQARVGGLRIRINAGEGHENEWRMEAPEFGAQDQADSSLKSLEAHFGNAVSVPAQPARNDASSAVTPQEVRRVVSEVLEAQLASIRRDVAALADPEPGVREIVGGLGWLVGLAGMALYFRERKQK